MITLHVESYCKNCSDFEPSTTGFYENNERHTIVFCTNRVICSRIEADIRKIIEEENV